MRQARHDQHLRHYHDRNVKETSFNVGDLVLRRIQKTNGGTLHCHGSNQPVNISTLVG
jgi:hypothetical protein